MSQYNKSMPLIGLLIGLIVSTVGCQSGGKTTSIGSSSVIIQTASTTASTISQDASRSPTTTLSSSPFNLPSGNPTVTTESTTPKITQSATPILASTLADGVFAFTRWRYAKDRFTNTRIFDPTYQNKIFQITGKITAILKSGGVSYIVVNDGSVPPGLAYTSDWYCYFQTDDSQLAGLKLEQTATVRGIWGWGSRRIGNLESDPVYLDNCVLTNSE